MALKDLGEEASPTCEGAEPGHEDQERNARRYSGRSGNLLQVDQRHKEADRQREVQERDRQEQQRDQDGDAVLDAVGEEKAHDRRAPQRGADDLGRGLK